MTDHKVKPVPPDRPDIAKKQCRKPGGYQMNEPLKNAVKVAQMLQQPLLVTGEPGTGKTQLAYAVADKLKHPLEEFTAKSNSEYQHLFYRYDGIRHFRVTQLKNRETDALDYIHFQALGRAILLSHERGSLGLNLSKDFYPEEDFGHGQSVVLIDEIDKAPREFPNDLLNQLETYSFKVPELDNRTFEVAPDKKPIVIITSNRERNLPHAFVRRCIYHHIEPPTRRVLADIVASRLGWGGPFVDDALDIYEALRSSGHTLDKKPATGEFLDWLIAVRALAPKHENPLRTQPALISNTLGILLKSSRDLELAPSILSSLPTPSPT